MTPTLELFEHNDPDFGIWTSVTFGRDNIGSFLNNGDGIEAYDADEARIGVFADKDAARNAISDRWGVKPKATSCENPSEAPIPTESTVTSTPSPSRCEAAYIASHMAEEGLSQEDAPSPPPSKNDTPDTRDFTDDIALDIPPERPQEIRNAGDRLPPEPDRRQLETLVRTLFKHATAGNWISLRAFIEGRADLPPFRIVPLKLNGSLDVLVDWAYQIAQLAAHAHEKVVFCPPIATFTNSRHAREQDLAEGLVLSVECDKHPQAAREKLEELLGPATVVVASG